MMQRMHSEQILHLLTALSFAATFSPVRGSHWLPLLLEQVTSRAVILFPWPELVYEL
jgi:hypothetical protein